MLIELYSKPGCPLCDEGKDIIDELQPIFGFEVLEHNILSRDDWFKLHRYDVPVVFIDGKPALKLRFTEDELRAKLKEAQR